MSFSQWRENEAPKQDIRELRLSKREKHFFTLLEVPFEDDSAEEIEKTRRLVTLAREVFVIWLEAARDCSLFEEIIPWEVEDLLYSGLAGHNLARNIKRSKTGGRRGPRG